MRWFSQNVYQPVPGNEFYIIREDDRKRKVLLKRVK